MKNIVYTVNLLISIALLTIVTGCSKFDEFRKFEEGGPIIYSGRPDSIVTLPGKNRIGISGIINDPNVVKLKVFWNNYADSIEIPVTPNPGVRDTFYISNLPEGVISFDIRTFDQFNNVSVPNNIQGTVYGNRYYATLLNRGVKSINYSGENSVDIEWVVPDTINVNTEFEYVNNKNEVIKIDISPETVSTHLDDYDGQKPGKVRSFYKPISNAIDTFATLEASSLANAVGDVTRLYLKNTQQRFAATPESGNDRFRTLADWVVTDNVKNAWNGVGGWVADGDTYICMESGWSGKSSIYDGKIYQTIELPAGIYSFEAVNQQFDDLQGATIYVTVAKGENLPNTNDVPSASLGFSKLYDQVPVTFTITEPQKVSMGFVATMPGNLYWIVKQVKLMKIK
jgi:hypothetical protein